MKEYRCYVKLGDVTVGLPFYAENHLTNDARYLIALQLADSIRGASYLYSEEVSEEI